MGDTISASAHLARSAASEKISPHIIPLMLFAYVIAYLDRVNIGFAKLQMLKDLGFRETIYGLGAGIFFFGYFLFGLPSNVVLHRVGARIGIAVPMICWGLISGAGMLQYPRPSGRQGWS